jgi:hypothetical protein
MVEWQRTPLGDGTKLGPSIKVLLKHLPRRQFVARGDFFASVLARRLCEAIGARRGARGPIEIILYLKRFSLRNRFP